MDRAAGDRGQGGPPRDGLGTLVNVKHSKAVPQALHRRRDGNRGGEGFTKMSWWVLFVTRLKENR